MNKCILKFDLYYLHQMLFQDIVNLIHPINILNFFIFPLIDFHREYDLFFHKESLYFVSKICIHY